MITEPEMAFLIERGWPAISSKWFDLCWLDCDGNGMMKTWDKPGSPALCICLCPEHALVLEQGRYNGDYDGAPLPRATIADEWPWQYLADVA